MVASGFRLSLALAALTGIAASSGDQDQLDRYATRMANAGAAAPAPTDAAMASAIAQWRALAQTDGLPFDSYAGFLLAHPGWPGEAASRRAAERQAGTASPASVVAFFRRFPPQSVDGGVAYARALAATGASGEAADAARAAWRRGVVTPADEAWLASAFAGTMSSADQDARMDALLWAGSTSAASRQVGLLTSPRRPAFEARLAMRTGAPNAADLAMSTQSLYAGDAGYVADRVRYLSGAGAAASARSWLAGRPVLNVRPANVERWFEMLYAQARSAAADGQYQLAYDIARRVDDAYPAGTDVSRQSYGERDEYTNLVWLAAQTAMKQLGRPADAMTLFDRYAHGSRSPQVRAKGFYWAGRAAAAAGASAQATSYLTNAAGYRDQFYGQLAAERLGRRLTPPPPFQQPAVDPATRAAYDAQETVRAVRFLGRIGDWQDQTAFVRQVALDATSDTDHQLGILLANEVKRPDLAVMIGRSALTNGFTDFSAAGYPTLPVPSGFERNWTLVHAISRQESQFDRAAISRAGARGLMQLMPATAREQAGKMGLSYDPAALTTDPMLSMTLGGGYFARLYDRFGSYPLAVAAYNAGGGNVNKWITANGDPRTGQIDMLDWIEAIPFSETRNYVQRVMENAVVYDLVEPSRGLSGGRQAPLSWYLGRNRVG